MPLINKDLPWIPITMIGPISWILLGVIAGFFLSGTAVVGITAILAVLILVIYIDKNGREIDGIGNQIAMWYVALGIAALWVTALSVNGWWRVLIPAALLRQ